MEKDKIDEESENVMKRIKEMREGERVEVGEGKDRMIVKEDIDDFEKIMEEEKKEKIVEG